MDSFKAPSRPFESSLKRSRTVGTSQVKRGGLGSILLLVFLFLAWPFCHPSTQRSPGCLTVYGWIDQSNDAWKSNIGGVQLSGQSKGTLKEQSALLYEAHNLLFRVIPSKRLRTVAAAIKCRTFTAWVNLFPSVLKWFPHVISAYAHCHTVPLSARVIWSRV